MCVVYHRDAEAELVASARYLERQSFGLGGRFLDAVDDLAERIRQSPEWFEIIEEPVRRAILTDFPFSILFRKADQSVRILAIKHHSRSDDFWKRRR